MAWDERQHENYKRAMDTLARADEALAQAQRRQEARESPWAMPEPLDPGQRTQSDPTPPLRRSAHTPRDWDAEAKWVRQICDQQISAFKQVLTDAIGQVVAEERHNTEDLAKGVAEDVNGLEKRIQQLEAMVAVLRVEQQRQPPDSLNRAIDRMNRLLDRLDRTRRGLKGDDDEILDLPLLN